MNSVSAERTICPAKRVASGTPSWRPAFMRNVGPVRWVAERGAPCRRSGEGGVWAESVALRAEGWALRAEDGVWAERPTNSERGGLRVEVASLRYAESVTIRQGINHLIESEAGIVCASTAPFLFRTSMPLSKVKLIVPSVTVGKFCAPPIYLIVYTWYVPGL